MKQIKKLLAVTMIIALALAMTPAFGTGYDAFADENDTPAAGEDIAAGETGQEAEPGESDGDVTPPGEVVSAPEEEPTQPTEEPIAEPEPPQPTNPTIKTTIKSVTTKYSKSYKKTLKDTITVSPAYGRDVELYCYDSYHSKWVLQKTFKTENKKTAKVKITYPILWKAYSSSKWKIVCPEYKDYRSASKTVKINNKVSKSKAAIIMDAETGEVLYAQSARKHLKIASMTKMVTMMVVCDNAKFSDKVKVSSEAVEARKKSGGMGLVQGDVIYMKDLIHATLMASANDAAAAAACGVSGSQSKFSALMVAKAKELGATESTFKYAFGDWHSSTHSTAYDQALIGREFMTNPDYADLRSIVKKRSYSFTTEKKKKHYTVKMGEMSTALIAKGRSIGIKSGYNPPAGYCYANAWKHNGRIYISIVMGASSNSKLISSQKALMKLGDYLVDKNGNRITVK